MRVLFQVRHELTVYAGGERTLANESMRALDAIGVQVALTGALTVPLDGYDAVHLFGLSQPTEPLIQARLAKARGVPVVLNSNYYDFSEYNRAGRYGLARLAYSTLRSRDIVEWTAQLARLRRARHRRLELARLLTTSHSAQAAELVSLTDVFAVGSASEEQELRRTFRVTAPCVRVPPGVSPIFATGSAAAFTARHGLKEFVVIVGFLTSLKNQLRLIEALDGTNLELVIVGQEVWTHQLYARAVRRAAASRPNVRLLGPMTPEELRSLYAAARVVVLPSWFETCGLTCLEGALAGCRVVITNRGYTRDYFCQDATYCDPGSVASIREAVLHAYDSAPSQTLQQRVREEYRWDRASRALLGAYERAAAAE